MLKNLVYLSIFTTFVVAVWVGLSLYHNFTTTTISDVAQVQIVPISNTFKLEIVKQLKTRSQIQANLSETIAQTATPSTQLSNPPTDTIVLPETKISSESATEIEL